MQAKGEPGASCSLIGRSELVDWCLVIRRVRLHGQLVPREHIARNELAPCACASARLAVRCWMQTSTHHEVLIRILNWPCQFWGLARAVGAFLKTGPSCRICPCSTPPEQLSQWARGIVLFLIVGTYSKVLNFVPQFWRNKIPEQYFPFVLP